jgi:hypothetical protein
MKLLLAFALLFALNANVVGQQTKTDYLTKSKNQKKAAWIMLGSGTGLIITSLVFPRGRTNI